MSQYTLTVPDDVLRRARRLAEQTARPVDKVMIEHLRTLPPSLPALPPEEEAELEALAHLSDDTLWTIVREQMAAESQERLQILMDKNSLGTLERDEANELTRLVDRGQRLMLRKSAAAALLVDRRHEINRVIYGFGDFTEERRRLLENQTFEEAIIDLRAYQATRALNDYDAQ